ncbi:BREX-2 system adenine-specific DNA-methyltransferase PglX [Sphaerotilus mobilis]|uniref:site-specific DNA-methyltransferase (adenine-specific) n=1 Tax=Sphaerotilus mobilis TaxID=47994 RepID=A0A4Q7LUB7_9BURK|nr:BREX-2 system adenine-specific DNA-methyltransferase PglX [Sphaerotilus mobilis]RZS57943.1 hypothetical protein EV685_0217 [Sphaerotilus mobilis]
MIHARSLLDDLTRQLKRLEDDLRQRLFTDAELPELATELRQEWQAARDAERCAETFESWVEQVLTQAGVHWLLSGVFLRFIEDNELIERPWLAGPPASGRLALAQDRHETYFRAHPLENDRDYLLAAFHEAGSLPGLHTFFDDAHNPVFRLPISGDAALALRQFWQQVDPDTGELVHDFCDAARNTRFLGDLYQDLSEATRKRYALLQTPEFVEEFILDRTLTPAIREFGFREVRLIDPTCGSGHFLLGAFHRLVAEWLQAEPGRNPKDVAQRALHGVAGVDLNPFAVAIARFRLWVAALQVAEVRRLADAPDFTVHVAIGDSLLHGSRFGLSESDSLLDESETLAGYGLHHAYVSEDLAQVNEILGRQYHAVVGNPPYIVVDDAKLNAAYRKRYSSCQGQYSLGVPFTERLFDLAIQKTNRSDAGFVGLITTNSFMKREFGPKLVKTILPMFDLTHVVDTSGAYIPGHGTPTVILFGRSRSPLSESVRAVLGIKGEPTQPDDPANGLVWNSILSGIDQPGFENDYVSATDMARVKFHRHPWRIGGGGAAELSDELDDRFSARFPRGSVVSGTGRTSADEAFVVPASIPRRLDLEKNAFGSLVEGDKVRDWTLTASETVFTPYGEEGLLPQKELPRALQWLWPVRTSLGARITFGRTTYAQEGRPWWGWHQVTVDRLYYNNIIAFSEIATHNHFVLDRGGKVFKQTAPVIKLPAGSSEDEHLGLLGLLNSSVACFWFQQVCHNKGGPGGGSSKDEKWHDFYAFNSTKVAEFPLVDSRPIELARRIDNLAQALSAIQPNAVLLRSVLPDRSSLDAAKAEATRIVHQMVALQEELDWRAYQLYGVLEIDMTHANPPMVRPGERAFEIVMARRMAAGKLQTRWFEWLNVETTTEVPEHWPDDYQQLVQRRIQLIETERNVGLIESFGCKRRWELPSWQELEQAALRDWLLDRLEAPALWPASDEHTAQISSVRKLADAVARDAAFLQVAELYAGQAGFDLQRLVAELTAAESVPFLPVLRYSETGLRKRAQWQATWELQRQEDAIDAQVVANNAEDWRAELTAQAREQFGSAELSDAKAWIGQQLASEIARQQAEEKAARIGPIPVPPKYQGKDFLKTDIWRLRGGLDVPKERWISYPGCERGADGSTPLAWAGWNHLQQATALAGYLMDMKDNEGWDSARLLPLLTGLDELVPWLRQWHNEPDPRYDGVCMGDYFQGFVTDQARELGCTLEELRGWKPQAGAKRRGGRPKKEA